MLLLRVYHVTKGYHKEKPHAVLKIITQIFSFPFILNKRLNECWKICLHQTKGHQTPCIYCFPWEAEETQISSTWLYFHIDRRDYRDSLLLKIPQNKTREGYKKWGPCFFREKKQNSKRIANGGVVCGSLRGSLIFWSTTWRGKSLNNLIAFNFMPWNQCNVTR